MLSCWRRLNWLLGELRNEVVAVNETHHISWCRSHEDIIIYHYIQIIYIWNYKYIYKDHPKMDAMKNLMKRLKESGTHSNINYGSQICQLSPLWDEQFYGCKWEDQRNTTMVACLHVLYLGTWSLMEPLELWSYIYIYIYRCVSN